MTVYIVRYCCDGWHDMTEMICETREHAEEVAAARRRRGESYDDASVLEYQLDTPWETRLEQPEAKEEPSALACQDCGAIVGFPLTTGFAKKANSKMYVAALCPDCMVKRMGLEWRELKRSSVVVPGRQQGVL